MRYHVIEAMQISGYILEIRFRDGTEGGTNLEPELVGPMFEPLKRRSGASRPAEVYG
jgi:hypothetical protein